MPLKKMSGSLKAPLVIVSETRAPASTTNRAPSLPATSTADRIWRTHEASPAAHCAGSCPGTPGRKNKMRRPSGSCANDGSTNVPSFNVTVEVVVAPVVMSTLVRPLVEITYNVFPRRNTSGTEPLYDCQPPTSDHDEPSALWASWTMWFAGLLQSAEPGAHV